MTSSVHELRASIELNTPAVLGGARPLRIDPYFKLRPSTVRGGLRYWFRAAAASMLWPERGIDAKAQAGLDAKMVEELGKLESFVFGDTEQRSRVIVLPLDKGGLVDAWRSPPDPKTNPGLRYLGYGLFESRGRPPERLVTRLHEPMELRLCVRDDRKVALDIILDVTAACLWLWTSFGGLGARGRRGFGSMQLVSLTGGDDKPLGKFAPLCHPLARSTTEHLDRLQRGIAMAQDAIKALVGEARHGHAELSGNGERPHPSIRTLDGITNLFALNGETDDPLDALEAAGALMQRYRSSLARKTPLPDYQAVKQSLMAPYRPPATVDRAAFGLPLNFYFRSLGGQKTQFLPHRPDDPRRKGQRRPDDEPDRLASPLLVRVHALEPRPGRRSYGVTLVNLAGRGNATPLQGCSLRQGDDNRAIAAPSAGILDAFIQWAVQESKQRPLAPRRSARGGRPR